ncbi:MAG: sugar MFS transporter [Gammaproteobacteria bacterium]|nr:sugar MFS transporter [Gammaproteobacteria bacterium]NVK88409.1 sugar MFS transporter [Gammaproteobacteria bacterium]
MTNIVLESAPVTSSEKSYRAALYVLTTLFFLWGFITSLNDILIPYLKGLFELSYFQAQAVNLCFFGAYAVISYPAGILVRRTNYQSGIIIGLTTAACGCLLFLPAAHYGVYGIFLFALFVLAAGITVLQVAANPFVSRLGAPENASFRLNLTQAFNSLGTTVAPVFGGILILSVGLNEARDPSEAITLPYMIIFGSLLALAITFKFLKLPRIEQQPHHEDVAAAGDSVWQHRHLVFGALAIFAYVGAEVAIGSFLVNYFNQPNIGNLTEAQAAHYVSYYWGGAMVGRFIGAFLMLKIRPSHLLIINAMAAILLLLTTIFSQGALALWSVLLVGLCNSIMFPTIFSLAIHRLGALTSQGSGLLCVAIVGGAIIPMLQGLVADSYSLQVAFFVPLMCYLYIAFFGWRGYRVRSVERT